MLGLRRSHEVKSEKVFDFQYSDFQSIQLPSSKILIGSNGLLSDASLYTASDLTFSFANGTSDNGLDSGSEVQDQWYALYAVPKPGTENYILKASTRGPSTFGSSLGSGPIGFTKWRYLGIFRNGTNGFDGTNGSFGRGDIARFTKHGRTLIFRSLNSTNGGLYPAASGTQGICLFVANTSINGIILDLAATSNYGFDGLNVSGNVKLPYAKSQYIFEAQFNGTIANSYIRRTDSSANDRQYISMTELVSLTRSPQFTVTILPQAFSGPTWDEQIRMEVAGNPNISRILLLSGLVDPYL